MSRTALDPRTLARAKTFSDLLKTERKAKGLSQPQLAQKAGIPLDSIRAIENARTKVPGVFVVADLVWALEGDLTKWLKSCE